MKCCQSGFPGFKGISHQQRQRLFCVAVGEWLWLLLRRQGTPDLFFTPASQSTIWTSQGFFLYVFPKAADEVRLQSAQWSAGRRHSTWMNAKKRVSAFRCIGQGSLSPKGALGLEFCQLRAVLKLQETNAKLVLGTYHQMESTGTVTEKLWKRN